MIRERDRLEWLEADGRGGFASGTVSGVRTRRYHALLLKAAHPPVDRFVLVNCFEAWVEKDGASFPITTQRYIPDVRHPNGETRIERFTHEPWPTWHFRIDSKTALEQEILVDAKSGATLVAWNLDAPRRRKPVTLFVRLLVSGRDFHALHRENHAFRFEDAGGAAKEGGEASAGALQWRPYEGVPGIQVSHDGDYEASPLWYRNFAYAQEEARGLDFVEDLASPGVLRFDLVKGEGALVLEAARPEEEGGLAHPAGSRDAFRSHVAAMRADEKKRRASRTPLVRAAGAYISSRGTGATILAGFPWFGDWGRDTFIAMRGLLLATGRFAAAKHVLLEWSGALSRGMMPNRFPDHGEAAEYNSVDASLWFVIAATEFLALAPSSDCVVTTSEERFLRTTIEAVVDEYVAGTRHRIGADEDGLLRAGEPGQQLTWMDARVDGAEVTPRIGKPVEVQALWLCALAAAESTPSRLAMLERGRASFERRFWNEEEACLFDVIDADHQPGVVDASIRPNQIFAVGGLPLALLEGEKARAVVDRVEKELWTPFGLRTISPADAAYHGKYEGGARSRDGAYHQGTAWPWLLGAFTEAWLRVRAGAAEAKREADERFVAPLRLHLKDAGIGHVSEIFDGDPPHAPRGCPFQAWSLGELIRMERMVAPDPPPRRRAASKRRAETSRPPR